MRNVLRSLRVARLTGCVAGGGEIYLRAASSLSSVECPESERFGVGVVRRALLQPISWIAINSGREPTTVIEKVESLPVGHGYDAERGEFRSLIDSGVLDPAGVALCALRNAATAACFMLSISTAVGIVTGEEDLSDHSLSHRIRR